MTVTPPREHAVRRTLRARAVALLAATVIALLPVVVGGPADAATPTPTPTPTPPIPVGTTQFTLSPLGNGVVRPGDALAVSVTLQNGTAVPTTPVSVTLELGSSPLHDRAALTAWLGGDTDPSGMARAGGAVIGAVPAGDQQIELIDVAGADPVLAGRTPGVYPLVAAYEGTDGLVSSRSAMIVPDDHAPKIGIGVVVPVTAGVLTEGLLTADQLSQLTAPSGALTNRLNAVEGTSAILAIDPAIPASIRVLGTSAPESALAWLDRLDAIPQARFALQFGDADVAVQLKAGLARPLQPTSLSAYMKPQDFIPDQQATPTATPEPTPTDGNPDTPVYPDLAALLDIGGGRPGVYWPAPGAAGPDTVATLGKLTADGRASLTIVPSASTVQGSQGATVSAHAAADGADLLVYDTDVSSALQQAAALDQTALRGAALTQATAYLAFATKETGGKPLLVTLDRDGVSSGVGLRSAILTAEQDPTTTPAGLSALEAAHSIDVQIPDPAPDPARVEAASGLFSRESELSRFATILDDPSLLTGPERAEILQLLGVAWIPGRIAWSAAMTEHQAATVTTLHSVDLLPTSTINLIGSSADLGFWVRNDLPYPVNLILYASPDNLRLDVQRATPVVAGASSNTRVEVPVRARVGNGEVTIALQLRSRTSVAIGQGATAEVNVRAEWEGVGIIALSVVVGVLLLLGIARSVLRVRSRRAGTRDAVAPEGVARDGNADAAGPAPDGDSGSDPPRAGDRS
ncbi:DUF6049 family protein [Microbacterium deminutum]|uniref:2-oxoglutarate dehydrogenase n=1 Tax=Microbacterium deminutum TaxID=344164 RepID=A0ABP5C0B7_9MICO